MSVAPPVVFDTNSLWNFAAVGRLDVLELRFGDRAAWGDTVRGEVATSVPWEPKLAALLTASWLGPSITLASPGCLTEVFRVQKILASPNDPPTKHLGEAESIHIIEHELGGVGIFATDDLAAADLADRRRLKVVRTDDILTECLSMGELTCPEPFRLLVDMRAAGRGVRVPASHLDICP